MGKPCSHIQFIKSHFLLQVMRESVSVRENPYQVLQVTRATSERTMKSKVRMIKTLSPLYQAIPEKYHSFVAVGICYSCCILITI